MGRPDDCPTMGAPVVPHPFGVHAADGGEPLRPVIVSGISHATGQRLHHLPGGRRSRVAVFREKDGPLRESSTFVDIG